MIDDKYKSILHLSVPTSKKHPRMSILNRAAQFAPFAALNGHDAAIKETARLTDSKIDLSYDELSELNEKLHIASTFENTPIAFTYFVKDIKKNGGSYVTKQGEIHRIDEIERIIILKDKSKIKIDDIIAIDSPLFELLEDEGS